MKNKNIALIKFSLNIKRDILCICRLLLDTIVPKSLRNSYFLFCIFSAIFNLDSKLYGFRENFKTKSNPQESLNQIYMNYSDNMKAKCTLDINTIHLYLLGRYLQGVQWESLLDVGCGTGEFINRVDRLFTAKNITGIDLKICSSFTPSKNNQIEFVSDDLKKYLSKLNDQSVDYTTCLHVLEHVLDYEKLLRELNRVSKKGVIIACPLETEFKWGLNYHINFFTKRKFGRLVYKGSQKVIVDNASIGDNLIITAKH